MCLLTFFPEGIQPDTDALLRGSENNSDGHGYAIIINDRITVRKSMTAKPLIEEFANLRKQHPQGPALFHSRIGTGGTITKSNCHPFKVGGDPRTVVAHNGILPASVQPKKGDPRCDTRIFAQSHLPYRNLNSTRSRNKLETWLAGDKLAVLTVNPNHQQSWYLLNEHLGEWDQDGVWYSNSSHSLTYGTKAYGYGWYSSNGREWVRQGYGELEDGWGAADEWMARTAVNNKTLECYSDTHGIHNHLLEEVQKVCSDGKCYIVDSGSSRPEVTGTRTVRTTPARILGPPTGDPPMSTHMVGEACSGCGAVGHVSIVTRFCALCLTCNECGGVSEDNPNTSRNEYPCMCYIPRGMLTDDTAAELDGIDAAVQEMFRDEAVQFEVDDNGTTKVITRSTGTGYVDGP